MGEMVSLKARNPFVGKETEMLSVKTWIGLGAFVVLAGAAVAGITWVATRAKTLGNPCLDAYNKLTGLVG